MPHTPYQPKFSFFSSSINQSSSSSLSKFPTMLRTPYGFNNSDTESEGSSYKTEADYYPPSPPREVRGVPTKCYTCGLPVVIRQPIIGRINTRKKFYICEAPEVEFQENHTYRWWDEIMEEEVSDLKQEVRRLKDTLHYITMDVRGMAVDPRQMWARVMLLQDQVYAKLNTCADKYEVPKDRISKGRPGLQETSEHPVNRKI